MPKEIVEAKSTLVRLCRTGSDGVEHRYILVRPITKKVRGVMVFIHGAAGFAAYMSDLMHYFSDRGFVCYAPDIIGHGDRGHIDISRARIEHYVNDVSRFIDDVVRSEWKRNIILVGHSMGGAIAQKLAENSYVRGTILITPAPPSGVLYFPGGLIVGSFEDMLEVVQSVAKQKNFTPPRRLIERFFADPVASREIIDKWTKNRVANESIGVLLDLGLSRIKIDRDQIEGPMLVIGAKKDKVIHSSVAQDVARYYGEQAMFVMLNDLGHMCPFEAGWEETAQVMGEWIKNVLKK